MLFDDITGVLGGAQSWVEQQWTQRIVQISVYAAILFFVLSSVDLINKVDGFIVKSFNVKLGKEGTRALHAATLGFFMYVGVKFILDPFVHKFVNGKTVEGQEGKEETLPHDDDKPDLVSCTKNDDCPVPHLTGETCKEEEGVGWVCKNECGTPTSEQDHDSHECPPHHYCKDDENVNIPAAPNPNAPYKCNRKSNFIGMAGE